MKVMMSVKKINQVKTGKMTRKQIEKKVKNLVKLLKRNEGESLRVFMSSKPLKRSNEEKTSNLNNKKTKRLMRLKMKKR
jgi:hypothetical protein